jgi:hypothetical protein
MTCEFSEKSCHGSCFHTVFFFHFFCSFLSLSWGRRAARGRAARPGAARWKVWLSIRPINFFYFFGRLPISLPISSRLFCSSMAVCRYFLDFSLILSIIGSHWKWNGFFYFFGLLRFLRLHWLHRPPLTLPICILF